MKRKWLAILAVCTMLVTPNVHASEESSSLEAVIQAVKKKVEIPAELTEFSYSSRGDGYYLRWNDKQNDRAIDVRCESDGDLLNYSYQDGNEKSMPGNLAKVDYAKAEKLADDFIKRALPDYAGQITREKQASPSKDGDYCLNYALMHNGIKVLQRQASIRIDKQTGKIRYFDGNITDEQAMYGTSSPAISKEQAEESYLSQIGLPLYYKSYYDNERKQQAFLAYFTRYGRGMAIDAVTGKKVTKYQESGRGTDLTRGLTEDVANTGDSKSMGLTPAEQEAVEDTKNFISAETLKEKLSPYFPALKNLKIIKTSCTKSEEGYKRYTYCELTVNGKNTAWADFTCDAKTGELYSYSYGERMDQDKPQNSSDWPSQEALALISKLNPEKEKMLKLDEDETYKGGSRVHYYFSRLHENVPVKDSGIYVSYDQRLKQVTSYSVRWNKQLNLPSSKGVLSQEEMVKKIGLGLYYMETGSHQYQLVYAHENEGAYFSAFTGKKVDYSGKEIVEETGSFYTDIAGHPDEDIIKNLYNSGIYLEGEKLHPDEAISQQEMIRLVVQANYWYRDDEDAYKDAIEAGIIDMKEKHPGKKLTKQEGIKYLISATPYKKVAAIPGLYQYPFDEKQIDKEMKGYVTIAYGLKVIQGRQFEGKKPLTKAEAMVMIYHYLQNNN